MYGFLLKRTSSRALVNVTIYDRCCKKTVLSWTICAIDEDEDTVKDFFARVLNVADVELAGNNLVEVHIGRDKNSLDRIGNLGILL